MSKEKLKIGNYGNIFAFILGREQKIALFELESVLRRFDVCFDILSLQDNIAIIKTEKAASSQLLAVRLMENLGGTVKIYETIQNSKVKNQNYGIESLLLDKLLENKSGGTLNFGISDYSNTFSERELKKIGIEIKKEARRKRPVRFVEGKGTELSSATSHHKIYKTEGEEFGIFDANLKFILNSKLKIENYQKNDNYSLLSTNYLLGRLVATTNPDEWGERDYGKPAGDKYSGMMPPKLARMLVNLTLGENSEYRIKDSAGQVLELKDQRTKEQKNIDNSAIEHLLPEGSSSGGKITPKGSGTEKMKIENLHNTVVLDPFCGSGNILMEAVLLGCDVLGSDISEKAVEDTSANLNWLIQKSKIKNQNCNSKVCNENNLTIKQFNNDSVLKADATSADLLNKLSTLPFDLSARDIVVVTEPYLGKPKKIKDQKSKIKDEITELKSLYLSFFNNLAMQQFNNSLKVICFVFPLIETTDSGTISLYNECVDELRQMGYNTTRTLRYGRDYQVTKREIVLLRLGNQRTEEPKNHIGNVL